MEGDVVIRLLGVFSVSIDGARVGVDDFPRRSGAELVQFLALAPGRRRHREQVIDALWPDATIEQAANRLYQAASHARRALGSREAIVLKGEIVSLLPDSSVSVDAAELEQADLDDADSVRSALAAWGGELLADAPYVEWAGEARDRLRRRYLELLAAVGRWRTILELDPTNEAAHLALMSMAAEMGDDHGVLRRFDELVQLLAEQVGAKPGPAAVAFREEASERLTAGTRRGTGSGLRAFLVVEADPSTDLRYDDQVLDDVIALAGGTVFERQPGRLEAVFPSASAAIGGAVDCQSAVQATEAGSRPAQAGVRIAIDAGEAEPRAGGWSGPAAERSAAIAAVGSRDQILCSSLVKDLAGPELGDEIRLVDLGLFRIPDLAPVRLAQVLAPGIRERSSTPRASRLAGRPLEPPEAPIFGREQELAGLGRQLESARLVTVVGAGGAGKTHLARHLGGRLAAEYTGGAWVCELATISDDGGVQHQMLAAVGGQRHSDTTVLESIIRTFRDRPTLVIVDNCEHVLDSVRELCSEILDRCPEVKLLATSREPIGLKPEIVVPLGELDRPAAVDLFVAEARRHGAAVDDDAAVARICQRLDDLPLAIRLAATRTRGLGTAEVERLLDDRFDAFRSLEHDGPPHHQTLRAAIVWSVDALDPGPRQVLIDLSVLADRFSLDAAVAVASRPGMTRGEVLDHVDELVRRSLVAGPTRSGEETSYRLLESVRLLTRASSTDTDAADRHLQYFLQRAEASDALISADPDRGLRRLEGDWDDIRRARGHAIDAGHDDDLMRLLAAVASFATCRFKYEYVEWCQASLSSVMSNVDTPALARAMGGWGALLSLRGELSRALEILEPANHAFPDDELIQGTLGNTLLFHSSEFTSAIPYLESAAARSPGQRGLWQAGALVTLAAIASATRTEVAPYVHRLEVLAAGGGGVYQLSLLMAKGWSLAWPDPDAAVVTFEEALAAAEEHDLPLAQRGIRVALSYVTTRSGSLAQALSMVGQSMVWFAEKGMWTFAMNDLPKAAEVIDRAGRPDIAATLAAAYQSSQVEVEGGVDLVTLRQRIKNEHSDHFDAWWAAGAGLDPPAAVILATTTMETLLARDVGT